MLDSKLLDGGGSDVGPVPDEGVRPASDASVFAICALAYFATGSSYSAYAQVERGFAANCSIHPPHISNTDIANMDMIATVAGIPFSLAFGFMADRFGRRPTLLAIAATTVLGGVGMTLASDWGMFLAGIAVSSAQMGFLAAVDAVLAEMISARRREKALLLVLVFSSLAQEYGNILRDALMPDTGPQQWRLLVGLLFAPMVLLLASVAVVLPESPVWLRSQRQKEPTPQSNTVHNTGSARLPLLQDQPLSQEPAFPSTRPSAVSTGSHTRRDSFGTGGTCTSAHDDDNDDMQSSSARWSNLSELRWSDAAADEAAAAPLTAAGNLRALLCGESSGSTLWLMGMFAASYFSSTVEAFLKLTAIGSGHEISSEQLLTITTAATVASVVAPVLTAVLVPKYISVGKLAVVALILSYIADTVLAIGITHGKSDIGHALFVGVPYVAFFFFFQIYGACVVVIATATFTPSQRALGITAIVNAQLASHAAGEEVHARLLDHGVGIIPLALVSNTAQVAISLACYKRHLLALRRSRDRGGRRGGGAAAAAAALADMSALDPSSSSD